MTAHAAPASAGGSLRQRLIDDMTLRRFSRATQRNDICDVGRLALFLRRSPDTATGDDLRRFQIAQQEVGLSVPTMNASISALRHSFATHLLMDGTASTSASSRSYSGTAGSTPPPSAPRSPPGRCEP